MSYIHAFLTMLASENIDESYKSMLSGITKPAPPARPSYGKGLESMKILASPLSAGMDDVIIPSVFPILGAYVSNCKFQFESNAWFELAGMMSHLIAESGMNNGWQWAAREC